jgi:hypothetical protein
VASKDQQFAERPESAIVDNMFEQYFHSLEVIVTPGAAGGVTVRVRP